VPHVICYALSQTERRIWSTTWHFTGSFRLSWTKVCSWLCPLLLTV
jgi:hypothetical protein